MFRRNYSLSFDDRPDPDLLEPLRWSLPLELDLLLEPSELDLPPLPCCWLLLFEVLAMIITLSCCAEMLNEVLALRV
jgi:hypothetical protein